VKLNQAKVHAAMLAARKDHSEVAHYMRHHGLPGTTAQWLRMAARGRTDVDAGWVQVWAAALGRPAVDLLAPADAALVGEMATLGVSLHAQALADAHGMRVLAARGHLVVLAARP
jgi:hypothetical protein